MLPSDIVRKTQRLFGDSTSEVILDDVDIWDWINEAQLKIVRETHCCTKTVTANASTYPAALPADWIITKRLTYNGLPLTNVDIDDLDALGVNPADPVDSPSYYYVVAKQIRLYPNKGVSDSISVVHDYVSLPTTIVASSTPLDVPVSFHEDVVRFCVMRSHERNENYKAQEISQGLFNENAGLRKEEATLQDDDYFIIRDDPGEDWL